MKQNGIALFGVMMALVLASLAVLASARTGLLHEMMTGQQADQLRAHALAEALVLDAEADILGHRAQAPCRPSATDPTRTAPGFVGCRERGVSAIATAPYFPQSIEEYEEVGELLRVGGTLPCRDGICAPSSLAALATLGDESASAQALGARYGQFTQPASAAASQAGLRGWYWVEIFRFHSDSVSSPTLQHARPDPIRPFVYRITALAEGVKPGTRAVVRTLFVPYPISQLP